MRVEVRTTTTNSSTESADAALPKLAVSRKSQSRQQPAFQSVLTKPFSLWNELEALIAELLPEWSPSQRSCLIKNVIRFLELRVVLEEYRTNKLLAPTELVAKAWRVLILETELYRNVTFAIQDFHGRPHRMIHHALSKKSERNSLADRLDRTQSLFMSYYGSQMPSELKQIDAATLRNTSFIGQMTTSQVDRVDSSLAGTGEVPSWRKDEAEKTDGEKGDDDEASEEGGEEDHRWYFPFPSCHCLPEAFCSKGEGEGDVADNIYAVKEDVSLLTPDD
ncbi:MAG: hypothetical protein SGARI_004520, partial [Bacillariaceae sp.]